MMRARTDLSRSGLRPGVGECDGARRVGPRSDDGIILDRVVQPFLVLIGAA
jgi:hypothetical protein